MSISSVSSVSTPPPIHPIQAPETKEPKGPDVKTDGDTDNAKAARPPALAPLPPGQGTRVDQIA
jgi:hypothetical protein